MYKPYATQSEIAKHFAPYKLGDTVTVLKNVEFKKGILEAGTVAKIADISLLPNVSFPKITVDRLTDYQCTSDRLFLYTLSVPKEEGTEHPVKYCNIEPEKIAEGIVSSEYSMKQIYASNMKETRKEQSKLFLAFVLICFTLAFAVVFAFEYIAALSANIQMRPIMILIVTFVIVFIVSALMIHLGRYGVLHGAIKRKK